MKTIASAGPWITQLEIDYVTDACTNGWYNNWSGYIDKFEESFASWIGVKYAISTSSCTGALHIIMAALDIKEGDEVIVPEATWIATLSAIVYLGGTPVFVDIEKDTWCMSPEDVERKITSRTRAIIPVHNYGHPADMKRIREIANKYDIYVVEDAAPGLGSKIDGAVVGSFGDVAAFSFQGAKPLVTGEGGMIVTDNEDIYKRCYYFWDHCRGEDKVLWNTDIGFKYKMSAIQAALGLGQLERVDEIIEKRRQIYFWYKEFFSQSDKFLMNIQRDGYYNNFYVPTIVLNDGYSESQRDNLSRKMSDSGVLNRPFWRAISKMVPAFDPSNTPIADGICARGINLPCASILERDDIEYAAETTLKLLDNL